MIVLNRGTPMAESQRIRVVMADDDRKIHELVTDLLKSAPDIQLVAHASDGMEAIAICEHQEPDLLLLDVVMPVMNGIVVCERLVQTHPNIKILVVSGFDDSGDVRTMLDKGARGYILKSELITDLLDAIRITYRGNTVLSAGMMRPLITPPAGQRFKLTDRELSVLRLLAQGSSLEEIADTLIIGRSTVKYHLTNILIKMDVETRAEAIALAAKSNLI